MFIEWICVVAVLVLFLGMMGFLELGLRVGWHYRSQNPEKKLASSGAVEGAIFAILGLLLAFSFSAAASRFDERRHLIINEANMFGTVWLRIDLLGAEDQPIMKDLMRRYLDSRLESYRLLHDLSAARAEYQKSLQLQNEIWAFAVKALGRQNNPAATSLLLSELNAMIDIATTRKEMIRIHTPTIIFVMLFILALACSFLAGLSMSEAASRNWIQMLGFALIISFTFYVILEIEFPRAGLIRLDSSDKVLMDVRRSMQ